MNQRPSNPHRIPASEIWPTLHKRQSERASDSLQEAHTQYSSLRPLMHSLAESNIFQHVSVACGHHLSLIWLWRPPESSRNYCRIFNELPRQPNSCAQPAKRVHVVLQHTHGRKISKVMRDFVPAWSPITPYSTSRVVISDFFGLDVCTEVDDLR